MRRYFTNTDNADINNDGDDDGEDTLLFFLAS